MLRVVALVMLLMPVAADGAWAQLRGHGGPVRALAIAPDGMRALSGSFDASAIRWSLAGNAAEQVLRFHEGAVNAVAFLPDGRMVTSGEDARIAIWRPGTMAPSTLLAGHGAPVVALAVSPDGTMLASASWDHTARVWPLAEADGVPRVLEGHAQNVNGIAFTPDGRSLVTAGYDTTLRIWPLAGGAVRRVVATLPTPLNAVAVAPDGEIVAAGADGKLYLLSSAGELRHEIEAATTPIIAVALSPDGVRIAAAGIRGSVVIIDRRARRSERVAGRPRPAGLVARVPSRWSHAAHRRGRPHHPSLGRADGRADRRRGAGCARRSACRLCRRSRRRGVSCLHRLPHACKADEGVRAGPTLAGIFGRKIASLPGYDFSDALKRLDIVWTPETVSKLFELGPMAYTPGTKMPEQRIGTAEERAALMRFLQQATGGGAR